MRLLISSVGDTDPIRDYRDGSLLHICRGFRPDAVLLLFSEGMIHKEQLVKDAILSISPSYKPMIEKADALISDEDAVGFNTAYTFISKILSDYFDLISRFDEVILNLSSGTPGLKNALFATSVLEHLPYTAVQVLSPKGSSNANVKVENPSDLEGLPIDTLTEDYDLTPDECFKENGGRIILEKGKAVSGRISKKTLEQMLERYDYASVREIVANQLSMGNRGLLLKKLDGILEELHLQKIPDKLKREVAFERGDSKINKGFRQAIQYFRKLRMQAKRGEFADFIVKSVSLAIFIGQEFLVLHDQERIEGYNDLLAKVLKACQSYDSSDNNSAQAFVREFNVFKPKVNSLRNDIAHDLKPVSLSKMTSNNYKGIEELVQQLLEALETMLMELYQLKDDRLFNYYDDENKDLMKLL